MKAFSAWVSALLWMVMVDASYGEEQGTSSEVNLCTDYCSEINAQPRTVAGLTLPENTNYNNGMGFGADLLKPIGGWDRYYAERIITTSGNMTYDYDDLSDDDSEISFPEGNATVFIRISSGTQTPGMVRNLIPARLTRAWLVDSFEELETALQGATAGEIVFIDPTVEEIELERALLVPGGVTLASDRGHNSSKGVMLYPKPWPSPMDPVPENETLETDCPPDDKKPLQALIVNGSDVRITGLRLRGPQREVHPWGNDKVYIGISNGHGHKDCIEDTDDPPDDIDDENFGNRRGHTGLEVDNCELFQWPYAAISLGPGATACVRNNYIHHNQKWRGGYGIAHNGSARSCVEENLFTFNRHAVAGSGYPTQGYTARHNVILGNSSTPFDMHGLPESCNLDCEWMKFDDDLESIFANTDLSTFDVDACGTGDSIPSMRKSICDVGGEIVQIRNNTFSQVSNDHRPSDYYREHSGGRSGPKNDGQEIYLRGQSRVDPSVAKNSFAQNEGSYLGYYNAFKQVKVNKDGHTSVYGTEEPNANTISSTGNGFEEGWSRTESDRTFFERFGEAFQGRPGMENTIELADYDTFPLTGWPYQWAATKLDTWRAHIVDWPSNEVPTREPSGWSKAWMILQEDREVEVFRFDDPDFMLEDVTTREYTASTRSAGQAIGEMRSKRFEIDKAYLNFQIRGFQGDGNCATTPPGTNHIALYRSYEDKLIFRQDVLCSDSFRLVPRSLTDYEGDTAYFVLANADTLSTGWIEVKNIHFTANPLPIKLNRVVVSSTPESSAKLDVHGVEGITSVNAGKRVELEVCPSGIMSGVPLCKLGRFELFSSLVFEGGPSGSQGSKSTRGQGSSGLTASDPVAALDNTLDRRTTYQFRVRLVGPDGEKGPFSDPVQLLGLGAEGDNGKVKLSWDDPDNASITGWEYRYRQGAGSWDGVSWQSIAGSGATTTTHVVENLANGLVYWFQVRPTVSSGSAPVSFAVSATPFGAPLAPGDFEATPGDGQVALSWSAAAANGAPVLRYKVRYFRADFSDRRQAKWKVVPGDSTARDTTITGLTNGVEYLFRVMAENEAGNGARAEVKATPSAVDGPGTVALSSTAPQVGTAVTATLSDPNGGITGAAWQWQRRTSATDEWSDISSSTSSSYTPVVGDVGYMLRATVGYADGNGPGKSAHSAATAAVVGPPGPPVLRAEAGNGQVLLSWTAPASTGGAPLLGYHYRESHAGGTTIWHEFEKSWSPFLVSNLRNGTAYTFELRAYNRAGAGAVADTVVTPAGPPLAPGDFEAVPGDGQVALSWTAADSNGASITRYEVQYYPQADPSAASAWTEVPGDSTARDTTIAGLTNGASFTFEVRAVNGVGAGRPSSESATPVNAPPVLSGPAAVSFDENGTGSVATYQATDPGGASIIWSWAGADSSAFTLVDGVLRFRSPPDFEAAADAGKPPNDAGKQDNVYEVTVEAGDGSLKSTLSVAVTVTNVDEPGTVTLSTTTPQVGTALTATLSDPDGGIADTTWQWQRRANAMAEWSDIGSAASSSYTPVDGDLGYMLQATVDYSDGHGPNKSAESTSTEAVTKVDPPGTVSLSSTSPQEGTAVTATLSDPSGGIHKRVVAMATAGQRHGRVE